MKKWSLNSWRNYPVKHIPKYEDEKELDKVLKKVSSFPPLVFAGETRTLKKSLGQVAEGKAFLLQGGDCAESFAEAIEQLEDEDDYEAMANRFAVRRTNPDFWQNSDDVMNWYHRNDPLNAGILDYNRLENR